MLHQLLDCRPNVCRSTLRRSPSRRCALLVHAPHDILPGKKIHAQIDEAIRLYDKLLLILSPASMASEWVKTEIANARKRERHDGRVLFPISLVPYDAIREWECFDADAGKDSAREIREYFIPDFSTSETVHDAYKRAFDRVGKSLSEKAASAKPTGEGV